MGKERKIEEEPETVRFITLDHDQSVVVELESTHHVGGQVIRKPIHTIQFQGPYYQTSNPKEIACIRGLDSFNKRIFENVLPGDMVQTGTEVGTKYVCSFRDCHFQSGSMEGIKHHKRQEHSKLKIAPKGKSSKDLVENA